jgi:hypothetical protein
MDKRTLLYRTIGAAQNKGLFSFFAVSKSVNGLWIINTCSFWTGRKEDT